MEKRQRKVNSAFLYLGAGILILLGLVGWYVLFAQKPDILVRARLRYNEAVANQTDLTNGPCLGKIADDWVLDIAHLPREEVDNLPQNQCADYLNGSAHHFVEMTPKGEVTIVQ